MNIALPALVILLILIPGFIVRTRFKIVERQSFDYSPFALAFIEGLIWALLLHAIWLMLTHYFYGYSFKPDILLQLLSNDAASQAGASKLVATQFNLIALYFATLFLSAYFLPPLIRRLISHWRLDRFNSCLNRLFRFNGAPWYYLLSGADFEKNDAPDLIAVSAVVNIAGSPYLYTGFLDEYYLDQEGKLDRLILEGAMRRPLGLDKNEGEGAGDFGRFYPIDGDYFVLRYAEIITLNIGYLKFEDESSEPA